MTLQASSADDLSGMESREFHVNGDFDLSLRPHWVERARSAAARQVRELPLHLLLMADPKDSVRAHNRPPEELTEELGRLGFELPHVTVRPAIRSNAVLVPFGWNDEAERLNQRYDRPAPHPPLEVVQRVNGRRFAAAIEAELAGGKVGGRSFRSLARLERFLDETPAPAAGWVVKAEHGNAALGNRRLRAGRLEVADRRFLSAVLAEDDGVLVEPWLDRCGDLSASFRITYHGAIEDVEVHEVINTADGAFIGARFGGDGVDEQWRADMEESSMLVARRLFAVGYWGPVCLDGLLWRDGGVIRIRPLVDLNARRHVSLAALRVWRGWERERVVFWRFFNRRKLSFPGCYQEIAGALGGDAFNPASRTGTVVTSPLWSGDGGGRRPTHRVGVLFAASSRDDTIRLERRFREIFE